MLQLSVLDLANIGEGFTPADALANALDLAQHVEAAGFARFWLAEHHNLAGIASAAVAAGAAAVAAACGQHWRWWPAGPGAAASAGVTAAVAATVIVAAGCAALLRSRR